MCEQRQALAREVVGTLPLVVRGLASELRGSGLPVGPVHLGVLGSLAKGEHNLSELAERCAASKPSMSKSVTIMVERGWISRVTNPENRRTVVIELTPAGRAVLEEMWSRAEEWVLEKLSSLSSEECDRLSAGLAVLRAAFETGDENPDDRQ